MSDKMDLRSIMYDYNALTHFLVYILLLGRNSL